MRFRSTLVLGLLVGVLMCALPVSSYAALLTSDLTVGSRGAEVTQLQLLLFQFGYSTAAPTGVFDEKTAASVRALQTKYGIQATGTVGAQTRAVINPFIARNPTSGASRPATPASTYTGASSAPLGIGSSGASVTELQQKLSTLGYFKEIPTGYFGVLTRAAVIALQAAHGLEQVGYIGPRTRALLATIGTTVPTDTGTATVTDNRAKAPTLSFRADKRSAPVGESVRLTWSTKNVDNCTAANGWSGAKAASGRESLTLPGETTYALVCTGPGGSVSKSVTVRIAQVVEEAPPEPKLPTLTFSTSASTVTSGGNVTLTWKAQNATSCSATGDWSGQRETQGSESQSGLTVNKVYTLACVGDGGSITRSIGITVQAPVVTTPNPTPTNPTPTPTPLPTPLPGPSKNYKVYSGCEAPAKSYARVVYIDPKNGTDAGDGSAGAPLRTLAAAFNSRKLMAGDHIILMPGDHGSYTGDTQYNQNGRFNTPNWTWFDFQNGATMSRLELRSFSNVLFTKPEFNAGGAVGTMLMVGGGQNVVIADGEFYSAKNTSGWSASDWLSKTSNGITSRNTRCVSIIDNDIHDVSFGINVGADGLPISDNAAKALVEGNEIVGFSGDGIRPNASDVTVRDNRIINSMLGAGDGDGNHDDGIQIFALNGHTFHNIRLEDNWIQESTSSTRPLIGSLQGIGHFDGPITDSVIRNNVVLITAYHGIATYGASNTVVENNTVANPSNSGRQPWIRAAQGKAGNVSQNVTLRNNVAASYTTDGGVTSSNNITVTNPAEAFTLFDHVNGRFDLRPKAGGPLDGKNVGAAGISSGDGSQASAGDRYGQVAGVSTSAPTLDELLAKLQALLNSLK